MTRIVAAAWRARRADRLEAALLGCHLAGAGVGGAAGATENHPQAALGYGLMRDNYGPRALETLVRYRGTVLAELFRALGALKALQAELHDRLGADSAMIRRPSDDLCTSTARATAITPHHETNPRSHNETNPRSEPETTA